MNQQYALVQWCGGDFDKTYTPDVPIEWIRGFDYESYTDKNFDFEEVYTTQWHDTARCPRGGWKLYDAYIIAVSENKKVLNKKMRIYEQSNPPSKRLSLDVVSSNPTNEKSEKNSCLPSQHQNSSDEPIIKKSCNNITKQSKELDEDTLYNEAKSPMTDYKTDDEDLGATTGSSTSTSNPRPIFNEDVMKKLDVIYVKVYNIEKLLQRGIRTDNDTNSKTGKSSKKRDFYVETVELGKPGSKVTVDGNQWASAISKNCPVHMLKTLLPCIFELDVLLDSNYKGGAPKSNKEHAIQRKRLDPQIIEALKISVNKTFPGQMSDSEFGQAINSKVASLRWQSNQRKNAPTDDQE